MLGETIVQGLSFFKSVKNPTQDTTLHLVVISPQTLLTVPHIVFVVDDLDSFEKH